MGVIVSVEMRATLRRMLERPAPTIVGIVTAAVAVWAIVSAVEWLVVDAQWAGSTPASCPDRGAACWPFIRARSGQFLYGYYPAAERWRVDTALCLLAAGLIVTGLGLRRVGVLAAGALALALVSAFALVHGGPLGLTVVPTGAWGGGFLSVLTVAAVFGVALPSGVLLAFGRCSGIAPLRAACSIWIEFWRAVPAVVVLFLAVIMLPLFLAEGVQVDKLVRAWAAMTVLMSAYLAEAFRGGLLSVPRGQYEAAQALGLGYWRTQWLIVLPQAFRAALPQITSSLVGLMKETTVLLIIGVPDFLAMVQAATSDPEWLAEGVVFTGLAFAAAVFWCACASVAAASRWIERRQEW